VLTVHEPKEAYTGEVCKSITVGDIYIPPSYSLYFLGLDTTLAPFLPPGKLQQEIENTVTYFEQQIPRFFPSDCLLRRREFMCGAFFEYVLCLQALFIAFPLLL
jgi:hypothetical protein